MTIRKKIKIALRNYHAIRTGTVGTIENDCIDTIFSLFYQELQACLPKEKRIKCNNHHFWKDRNPSGCFNCGKTQEEIIKNCIRVELLSTIQEALKEKGLYGR